MASSAYKITLVEPHGVRSRAPDGRVLGSVRINVPLHSQLIVGGILQRNEILGKKASIEIYNPKTKAPLHEEIYKIQKYGNSHVAHYRVGEALGSNYFRNMVLETDILGITVNFTQLAGNAIEIAARALSIKPDIKIVAGGSDAYYRAEYYVKTGYFDVIAPKDSELVADRIILALLRESGETLARIPGIVYNDDGIARKNPSDSINNIEKMRNVPLPAFDLVKDQLHLWTEDDEGPLPTGIKTPLAYVEFNRGCHERCPFCTIAGVTYSFMETEQVTKYIEHLKKFGLTSILDIADNTLTQILIKHGRIEKNKTGRQLLIDRYDLMKQAGLRWNFGNGLQISLLRKVDGKLDTDLIGALFGGAYALYAPVEDPLEARYPKLRGLPSLRRTDTRTAREVFEQNMQILEYIAALGLSRMTIGIIIGYPNDTKNRIEKFGELLLELKTRLKKANPKIDILFTPFLHEPLPGTQDYYNYLKAGVMKYSMDEHPECMQYGLTTYGKNGMDEWEHVEARLWLIKVLNGEKALKSWTTSGAYPKVED